MDLQILQIADLTALLGVSRPTIDRWVLETRRGENDFPLPFTQRGRRLLWTKEAVANWINNRQQAVAPPINVPTARQAKAAAKERQRRREATERALERHRHPKEA